MTAAPMNALPPEKPQRHLTSPPGLRAVALRTAAGLCALLGGPGVSWAAAPASSGNEAILAYAVATRGGAWCTEPVTETSLAAQLQPPLTVEGWFRSEGPGVLLTLSGPSDPGLSLSLGAD